LPWQPKEKLKKSSFKKPKELEHETSSSHCIFFKKKTQIARA
jgi:hypothetical protein